MRLNVLVNPEGPLQNHLQAFQTLLFHSTRLVLLCSRHRRERQHPSQRLLLRSLQLHLRLRPPFRAFGIDFPGRKVTFVPARPAREARLRCLPMNWISCRKLFRVRTTEMTRRICLDRFRARKFSRRTLMCLLPLRFLLPLWPRLLDPVR